MGSILPICFNFSGEIVCLSRNGVKSVSVVSRPLEKPSAFCIFEYVYFARADSVFEGDYMCMHVYRMIELL